MERALGPIISLCGLLGVAIFKGSLLAFVGAAFLGTIIILVLLSGEAIKEVDGHDCRRLLRALRAGGTARLFYRKAIRWFLRLTDHLLGDAHITQPTIAKLSGSSRVRRYWTAPSFDRLVVISLAYPTLTIFITWFLTGDAGEFGNEFGLMNTWSVERRLALALIGSITCVALYRTVFGGRIRWWLGPLLFCAVAAEHEWVDRQDTVFIDVACAVASIGFVVRQRSAFSMIGAVAMAGTIGDSIGVNLADAVGFGGFSGQFAVVVGAIAGAFGGAWMCVEVGRRSIGRIGLGGFWLCLWTISAALFFTELWIACLAGVEKDDIGLLTLVMLVPLLNVPFDWASVGLTRLLLWRGCEIHGPRYARSPWLLGLTDAVLALALSAVLAVILVISLDLVEAIYWHAQGKPFIDISDLIQSAGIPPIKYSDAWMFFVLFSTLIPSLFNLIVGILAITTFQLKSLREWLVKSIERSQGRGYERTRLHIVAALSGVPATSVALAVALLYGLWKLTSVLPNTEPYIAAVLNALSVHALRALGAA